MKPELIMHSDPLDILFEGRNKSYGAYALRKEYPKRMIKSLSVIVLLMLALLSLQFVKKNGRRNGPRDIPETAVAIVNLASPVKPPAPLPPMKKPVFLKPPPATIKDFVPKIVPDPQVKYPMPTTDDLDTHVIGDSTADGPAPDGTQAAASSGGENGKQEAKANTDIEPKIVDVPDVAPEFPGGVDGWVRFLKKNLRPKESDEAYNVRVVVNFLVNEDGTISELRIIQSGGADFDNEVLRVMRKCPKWNAGIYHGHKVKVYHAQPVVFVSQSDE